MAGYGVAGPALGSSLAGALAGALGCSLAGALGCSLAGALGCSLAAAVGVAAVVGAVLGAVDGAVVAAVDARGLAVGPAAGVHATKTNIATSPAVANVSHLGLWDMRVIPPLFTFHPNAHSLGPQPNSTFRCRAHGAAAVVPTGWRSLAPDSGHCHKV